MNFLFWNIKSKNNFLSTIQNVVSEEDVDVVAFAEFPSGHERTFENNLQQIDKQFKYLFPIKPGKIELFYRSGCLNIVNAYDGERIRMFKIFSSVDKMTYQLVFCHIWSKFNVPKQQLYHMVPSIVSEISHQEEYENNRRTIVCGDFNMDTYEDGMLLNNGFNAMMTENIAKLQTRRVMKQDYSMFYNPMWGLYGDVHGSTVAGTYYYRASFPIHQYWHMLDQVIMRPDVIPVFDKQALKIVAKGKTYSLLNNKGIIDQRNYSDHLPIKFKLNI